MRLCKLCGIEKEETEFYYSGKPRKDGTRIKKGQCKECETKRLRDWRLNNPIEYRKQHSRSGDTRKLRRLRDNAYREEWRIKKSLNSKKNFIGGMLSRARQRAGKYNIPFEITKDDITVPDVCPILGLTLTLGTKGDYQSSPSIDRVIPDLGYIKGNVFVISTLANTMKSNASKELLLTFCQNIPKYLSNMI